ncbi:metabolite traffic protein EboE [Agromyces sp. NPDC055520]
MQLSYCTNVHPAEDLEGVLEQLDAFAGPVRRAAGLDELGVGLWLPADLAAQLAASADDRARLRERLDANGLVLRTINAFPYRAFHADVVKHDVYLPDWADPRRARYTLDCAAVLADLLPEGAAGSISTLPLAWREPWTADDDRRATEALADVSWSLRALREATGRTVRVAIEPEPGCVLDTVADVVDWLAPRIGASGIAASGEAASDAAASGDLGDARAIDPEFVGVCLDTCHLAVSFADPVAAVRQIGAAGLRVVKVQASAALHVDDPADPASRAAVAAFVEARYLHQTRVLRPDGSVAAADDLPEALASLPTDGPWRVHFHVPLHLAPRAPITATTNVLTAALDAVRELPHGDEAHLDVETYTWSVLPDPVDDLVAGIAGEVRWAAEHLLGGVHAGHAASTRSESLDAKAAR